MTLQCTRSRRWSPCPLGPSSPPSRPATWWARQTPQRQPASPTPSSGRAGQSYSSCRCPPSSSPALPGTPPRTGMWSLLPAMVIELFVQSSKCDMNFQFCLAHNGQPYSISTLTLSPRYMWFIVGQTQPKIHVFKSIRGYLRASKSKLLIIVMYILVHRVFRYCDLHVDDLDVARFI